MIADRNPTMWPKWLVRLLVTVALFAGGCVVNPVPTPGSADESTTILPSDDGKTNDASFNGGATDAGASQTGDDIAVGGPGDVSPTDASVGEPDTSAG